MSVKFASIRAEVNHILTSFAEERPGWDYLKSRRLLLRKVSKDAAVSLYTRESSKSGFVAFEFSLNVRHRLMKKVANLFAPRGAGGTDLAVTRVREAWTTEAENRGSCTVYRNAKIFDEAREAGRNGFLYPEEFPAWLDQIFELAEAEIDRLFDLSSEEALIRSVVAHPIGFFRPGQVLAVQLALDNPGYYDELIAFFDQPLEEIRKTARHGMSRQEVDRMMQIYRETPDFPTFSFV